MTATGAIPTSPRFALDRWTAATAVRSAALIAGPLVLGHLLGAPQFGAPVALGALWTVLQDHDGQWGDRWTRMGSVGLTSVLALTAGVAVSALPLGWILFAVAVAAIAGGLLQGRTAFTAVGMHLVLGVVVGAGLTTPLPAWSFGLLALLGAIAVVALSTPVSASRHRSQSVVRDLVDPVRTHLTTAFDVRFAVVLTGAILVGEVVSFALPGTHGFWLPMTVAFIVRPDIASVTVRSLHRLLGTIAALVVVAAVTVLFPGPWAASAIVVASAVALPYAMRWNYGAVVCAFTPITLALAGPLTPDHATLTMRFIETLCAGLIALAADVLFLRKRSSPHA